MKHLIKSIIIFLSFSVPVLAQDLTPPVPMTAGVPTRELKSKIYESFVDTRIETRLIEVKIKKYRRSRVRVAIMWQPRKIEDMLEDMMMILETINKVVPEFSVISLRAVDPKRMRWSKTVIWEAFITKKAFILLQQNQLDKFADQQPQPLF